MAIFNICKIQINNLSNIFDDLVLSTAASLVDLGHECSVTTNEMRSDAINILIGSIMFDELLSSSQLAQPYIVYQLEILDDELGHLKKYPSYLGFLSRALSVWDYSPKNISFLKAKGFNNLAYIPPGYHPICEKVSRQNSRHDFDFLFIGALSKRRANLLEALMKRGHKVGAITDSKPAFGETRDQVMANSKIILNIHCFDNLNNLETVRLSYLLTNRAVVISEESDHDPYQGAIGYAKYEDLVDYCDSILFEDNLEMRSKSGYDAIKSIDMLDLLGQALLKIDIHSAR
jgi:hypothetical protein